MYHEILAISNAFKDLTHSNIGSRESELHHKLDGSYAKIFNTQPKNISDFLKSCGNPYLPENRLKFCNFVTSVCALPVVSERLINFYNNGQKHYELFRNEKFVDKSCKLSDTIKKHNLPEFCLISLRYVIIVG